jgi:hypothetical protein
MKAILALLIFMLVSRSYAGSIKDDLDHYDDSVISANTHYKNGKAAFENSQIKDANVEYVKGNQAIETAKRQEEDIRAYLIAHPEESESEAIRRHVDERHVELGEIDANLEVLEKDLTAMQIRISQQKISPAKDPSNIAGSHATPKPRDGSRAIPP